MKILEKKIILVISKIGPTFISKLANRLLENQNIIRAEVENLIKKDILMRVENVMVRYKSGKNTVIKHRNHTYYDLTKVGKQLARTISHEEELTFREAFKTYNKSLQNYLDNAKTYDDKEYYIIDIPYSEESKIKTLLSDEILELEKEYGTSITIRGKFSKDKIELIKEINNIIIIKGE